MSLKDYEVKDIGELVQILVDQDPRTLEEMARTDDHYDDLVVKAAAQPATWDTIFDGRTQEVTFESGSMGTFPVRSPIDGQDHIISPGDVVRCYGWPGGSRYGHAINGELVIYQTRFERFASRMEMLAGFDRDKRIRWAKQKAQAEEIYEKLSQPFKVRIDRFKAKDPTFIFDMMYEMIPCALADRILDWVGPHDGTPDAVRERIEEFKELLIEDQKKILGDLSDGISGRQFESACALAYAVATGQEV